MLLMAKKPKLLRRSVTFRIPEDMMLALEKLVETTRRTLTSEIELALEQHLSKGKQWPPQKRLYKPADADDE